LNKFGGDAEAVEALVCKTSLSGFESHRYLQKSFGQAQAFFAIVEVLGSATERPRDDEEGRVWLSK
jgi:hypothetical protein